MATTATLTSERAAKHLKNRPVHSSTAHLRSFVWVSWFLLVAGWTSAGKTGENCGHSIRIKASLKIYRGEGNNN